MAITERSRHDAAGHDAAGHDAGGAGTRPDLRALAEQIRPRVLAGDRLVAVQGPLGALLPGGGVPRGGVVSVCGDTGITSTGLVLAAAVTAVGEWAVAVDDAAADGATLGGLAALEVGVVGEHFAAVRHVPAGRWASVVAALLEGVSLVVATPPRYLRTGDARRLAARARERDSILVVLGSWSGEAALRVTVEDVEWRGLRDDGSGLLEAPLLRVRIDGRGTPTTGRFAAAG